MTADGPTRREFSLCLTAPIRPRCQSEGRKQGHGRSDAADVGNLPNMTTTFLQAQTVHPVVSGIEDVISSLRRGLKSCCFLAIGCRKLGIAFTFACAARVRGRRKFPDRELFVPVRDPWWPAEPG